MTGTARRWGHKQLLAWLASLWHRAATHLECCVQGQDVGVLQLGVDLDLTHELQEWGPQGEKCLLRKGRNVF